MPKHPWNLDGSGVRIVSILLAAPAGLALAQPLPSTPSAHLDATAERSALPVTFDIALLEVILNGQNLAQTALLLRLPDGRLQASASDLARWRLRAPATPAITYQNEPYLPLDALDKLSYQVDAVRQALLITSAAENFLPSIVDAPDPSVTGPKMPSPGGFVNYDLSTRNTNGSAATGAQLELGAFAAGLVATTQLLNPDVSAHRRFTRLESTITLPRPAQLASLRLGDAISRAGMWGRPVRFGGVQWTSNFDIQPEFITFPLPVLAGSSALPATAHVFVNNALSYQRDLEAGPFSMRSVPAVSGQGEVRMVVRDLLGREQVIVQQYYAARNLLRSGLDDFSYEFGRQRENFTSASNDYGPWLLAATRRHGFSERLTAEVHGELRPGGQTLGLGASALCASAGVVDVALAASHGSAGGGALLALGFEHQSAQFSVGLRTQLTSALFEQLGLVAGIPAPLRQSSAHLGWSDARFGSFGLGYVGIDNRGQPDSRLASVSYSHNLRINWNLGASGFKSLVGAHEAALSIMLTHAFGARSSASASASRSQDNSSAMLQLQQNLPPGPGIGYRVLAGRDTEQRGAGALSLQNDAGTYALEAARSGMANTWRASVSGAVALLGGQAFLARRLGDSFAVVRVPGFPGVVVYAENQPVARTDRSGAALVPGLHPYQKNRLGIEQADLPLDAQIGALEATAVPYYRSGYDLVFPVGRANAALLRVVTPDGQPLPAGTALHLAGHAATFPVAQDGQTYVTGLAAHNQISAVLGATVCRFALAYVATSAPQPDLGTFVCRAIAP